VPLSVEVCYLVRDMPPVRMPHRYLVEQPPAGGLALDLEAVEDCVRSGSALSAVVRNTDALAGCREKYCGAGTS